MAGHSKWKQIKHKKAAADQKRAQSFAKLANLISIAAKADPNPDFNPTLRSAIERAKKENMPAANIERAIKRVTETGSLEEILIEAYGPEGIAIVIKGVTDNKPRSLNEIKIIMKENDIKLANPGAVMWSFSESDSGLTPNFKQAASEEAKNKIGAFIEALEEREDIATIVTNIEE